MSLLVVVIIALIAYVVHLDRRLAGLERRIADRDEIAATSEGPWTEPESPPPAAIEEPALIAEAPATTILYVEQRERDDGVADDIDEDLAPEQKRRFSLSFEELFGRRLPIWAGGITLAVAGILIVKLSIEAGLLSPPVRVIAGLVFGAILIGAAEAALRFHRRVGDVRVRQALSGAGLATLYASVLVAANLYHLVPPFVAMTGIAAVTGAAMLLAIRFGAPSALLGLAGGLAAPALIGSDEPNIPLLALYLTLAVGGLAVLSRNQRWAWLGISALIGGFGWGLALLLGGALNAPESISLGLYILLLGVGIPALGLAGSRNDRLQLIAGIVAAAQMAGLVATGGFALLNWGLFATIAVATVWLAAREPALERLPAVGLAIALLLASAWPTPDPWRFALVLAGIALIQGVMPLRRLWNERGGLLDAAQIAAIGLGAWLLAMFHFHLADGSNDTRLGLLALGLALSTGLVASLGWKSPQRRDSRFAIIAVSSAVLLAGASSLLIPGWLVGVAVAAIGLGLLHLGQAADDKRFEPIAWIFAAAGLVAFVAPDVAFGNGRAIDSLRCALMALVAGLFAWRALFRAGRGIAQFLAPVLFYFAVTPWIGDRFEPLIPALMLVGIAGAGGRLRGDRLLPALAAGALMCLIWALEPLGDWSEGAAASLVGIPMLIDSVPGAATALLQLLVPGILVGTAAWIASPRLRTNERVTATALAGALATVGAHSLYKQLFAIASTDGFIALGMAERTLWEALLASGAAAALSARRRGIALALFGASIGHFALYTLILHNPLWALQSVGSTPLFNLLLAAYALPLALLAISGRMPETEEPRLRHAIAIAEMVLIALFAFSSLRQLFHGSVLTEPGVGQAEDIARSILAIVVAIGFLLWGIVRHERDWRVGSLVLMVAAVGKVFVFDASGLEGLTRIASFIALGLSLIGIGWLYARHLPEAAPQLAKVGSSR
jgi:uncharacterized membrane protein